MAEDVDREQRTEPATPRRREKSREKGEFARSTDVLAAAVLTAALLTFTFYGRRIADLIITHTRGLLGNLHLGLEATSIGDTVSLLGWVVMPISLAGAACAVGAGVAQSRGLLAFSLLSPDISRIDPFKRFKEQFLSTRVLVEVAKAVVKFLVVASIAFLFLSRELPLLAENPPPTAAQAVGAVFTILLGLALRVGAAFIVLAGLDWFVERARHERRIRMSRHEIKQELKEEDGDPFVRRRRRLRHRDLARRRALLDVPKADVVVVNPTEYAVAIRYQAQRMRAPRVIAKGRHHLADRIRQIARTAGVPIVREPPLARLLYRSVEIGREIPVSLYRAVAEVLAYVYRLRRHGASGAARGAAA